MDETIKDNIIFNFLMDQRKRDIDKKARATILREYMENNNLTQRSVGKELSIPHSTIHDWLLLDKISEEEYIKLKEEGHNDTAIYRMLRNNNDDLKKIPLDILALRTATVKAKSFYHDAWSRTTEQLDPETSETIKELVNILNRLLIKGERSNLVQSKRKVRNPIKTPK